MPILNTFYIFQREERMFVRNICKLQGNKKHWQVLSLLGINHSQTSDVKSGRNMDFSVFAAKIFGRIQSFFCARGTCPQIKVFLL